MITYTGLKITLNPAYAIIGLEFKVYKVLGVGFLVV